MKNIEILVDATGSCDLKSIEQQLIKMQNEFKNTDNQANVSFYSFGEVIHQDLQSLELPLSEDNKNKIFGGGTDFNQAIKEKLKNNPDVLVFIGDCIEESIHKYSIEMIDKTNIVVIQSKYQTFSHTPDLDPQVLKNFVSEIADLPFVKTTNVELYTSLENLFDSKQSVPGNIKHIKMNISQDKNFEKLKP